MDPTGADVDAVGGQPEGAAALALLPPFMPPLVGGEEVGAYEGGVLAAEEGAAGVRRPTAYGCASARGHMRYLGRDADRAWGGAVPTARGQQQSQQLRAEEGDTVRHVYLLSQVAMPPGR